MHTVVVHERTRVYKIRAGNNASYDLQLQYNTKHILNLVLVRPYGRTGTIVSTVPLQLY